LEEKVAIWATVSKGDTDFETNFKLRGHRVVSLMCHVLNVEDDEWFEKLVYCVSAEILQRMFDTHHHNWMDKKKKKPHDISPFKNHKEYLVYLDREKLVSHRFSNILNQMLKWTGAPSILKKGSQSLLPKYINIPQ
ncbi:hypothetical protein PIB30_089665, partial [Stylosanthes scabra]|nr:hypothetical protein [Stylosanthes scabra]